MLQMTSLIHSNLIFAPRGCWGFGHMIPVPYLRHSLLTDESPTDMRPWYWTQVTHWKLKSAEKRKWMTPARMRRYNTAIEHSALLAPAGVFGLIDMQRLTHGGLHGCRILSWSHVNILNYDGQAPLTPKSCSDSRHESCQQV